MENILNLILTVVALIGLPAGYLMVCRAMRRRGISDAPFVPFFLLFGTAGGWVLAYLLSPSGLAAICLLFLASAAPLTLLIASILLARRSVRTPFHRFAMWAGFAYCGFLAVIAVGGLLFQ